MPPRGIIYQTPGRTKRIVYHLLRGIGAGFIAFAIVGIIFTFWPIAKEELNYKPQKIGFGDLLSMSQAESLGLDPYFSIYIPKINAKARVIPNVNAGDQTQYMEALSEGVAHAAGTNFPGQGKTIFLFSHSTDSPINIARYNAVFYLLRKLEKGDRIVIYFLGQEHDYIITDRFTTSADDTSWLKDDGNGERLILQTCDPPGTSWNRLLVIARPI